MFLGLFHTLKTEIPRTDIPQFSTQVVLLSTTMLLQHVSVLKYSISLQYFIIAALILIYHTSTKKLAC